MRTLVTVAAAVALAVTLTAGVAFAAGVTPTARKITTGAVAPPAFYVNSVQTTNAGGTAGLLQATDQLTTVFAGQASQPTFCSSWSNASASQSLSGSTFTLNDNAGAGSTDTLTVTGAPAACSGGFHFGTFDLRLGTYVSGGNATFTNSTIALTQTATSTTLTLTLGTPGGPGTLATVAVTSAAIYRPDATITSIGAVAIGLNTATTTTTVQF